MDRYLKAQIVSDLKKKMVFVAGPRQVGKTTLAKSLSRSPLYLNWDIESDRRRILKQEFDDQPLWIFDEIHKYKSWRNFLKGIFDEHKATREILVTGSAKLDVLRRSGESLQGRYHFLRLHPLTAAELGVQSQKELENLFRLSGFPEPFLSSSETEANRWSSQYSQRLIMNEVAGIEQIKDLGQLELLTYRLPELVSSPLSINSLSRDLQVSHKTLARWLTVLETFYGIFRLAPFGAPKLRAVKKEQKHYHFDWNLIEDEGARFENMVAVHLLKWVQYKVDTEGRRLELRYFRDIDLRECDFVVTERQKPILFIECKLGDGDITRGLIYLKQRFPKVDSWQISLRGKKDYLSAQHQVRVAPALDFLRTLV